MNWPVTILVTPRSLRKGPFNGIALLAADHLDFVEAKIEVFEIGGLPMFSIPSPEMISRGV